MTLERYVKIAHSAKPGEVRLLADTLLRLVAEVRDLHEATEPIRARADAPHGECACGGDRYHEAGCPTMVRLFVAAHPAAPEPPPEEDALYGPIGLYPAR
jgi:hypothetical protein